jgi:D-alanyl-D-alanine endopeptidase (penicillin-binding protein 7)
MKILSIFIILCWVPVAFAFELTKTDSLHGGAPDTESLHYHPEAVARLNSAAAKSVSKATLDSLPYIPAKDIRENADRAKLKLRSHVALVFDERDNEVIFQRNAQQLRPVASLSKLMTAMVILDAALPMDEVITISKADKDRILYSRSRLHKGMKFKREDLLLMALLASENRAALALARTYPGGTAQFVKAMNSKAHELGLMKTHFSDSAGLRNDNVSTANELLQIVKAASGYPVIREFTTQTRERLVDLNTGREVKFGNTNRLVKLDSWPITLSKTGFTHDAGNCLVMQTEIHDRPLIIVLLNSWGKLSKYGDSNRIKKWLIKTERLISKNKATEAI